MSDLREPGEEWMAEHGRYLRRLAGALLGDEALAEDAAQDAWVAALAAAPPRNPAGWLVTATRRLALRSRREAARRDRRERASAREESVAGADALAARAELARLVGEVVSELPAAQREVLLLRFWEGLPPRSIAVRLDVPVATVRSRTQRGLARVRGELERRSAGRTDWRGSLALVVGLPPAPELARASTTAVALGAFGMNTKTWTLGAIALAALIGATAVRLSLRELRRPAPAIARPGISDPAPPPSADAPLTVSVDPTAGRETGGTSPAAGDEPEPASSPRLSVLVVDFDDRPVEGALLLAGSDSRDLESVGRTAADGRASIAIDAAGTLVGARAAGFAPTPLYAFLPADAGPEELVLRLPMRGVALEVRVTDPGGVGLRGARVFAGRDEEVDYRSADGTLARTAPWVIAQTDGAGTARFPGLPPGWLRVRVEHERYAPTTRFATLELGTPNLVEVQLEEGLTVTGRVRDGRGAPVADAVVRRGSAAPRVATAADGSYRLGPIQAGKVVVEGPAGRVVEKRLSGDPGAVVEWNPVLTAAPLVTGRVVDEDGARLAGWWVHANSDTWPGWRRGAATDERGEFAIHGDRSEPLRLEVRPEAANALPWATVEGVAIGTSDLVIEVPRTSAAVVDGRVVREDGGSVVDLPLYLRHETTPGRARLTGGAGRRVAPDGEGRFLLEDVPDGRYELVVEGAPYGWMRVARCEVDGGGTASLGELVLPPPGRLRARTWWGDVGPTGDASYLLERRADQVRVLYLRGTFPEEMSLAPGRYTLQTEVTPGPQREVEFEIRAGATTPIELELSTICAHRVRVRYASERAPAGAVDVRIRRLDDDLEVYSKRVSEVAEGAWLVNVDLGAGRYEFTARDGAGLVGRQVENLYTSEPGREVFVTLPDAADSEGD